MSFLLFVFSLSELTFQILSLDEKDGAYIFSHFFNYERNSQPIPYPPTEMFFGCVTQSFSFSFRGRGRLRDASKGHLRRGLPIYPPTIRKFCRSVKRASFPSFHLTPSIPLSTIKCNAKLNAHSGFGCH